MLQESLYTICWEYEKENEFATYWGDKCTKNAAILDDFYYRYIHKVKWSIETRTIFCGVCERLSVEEVYEFAEAGKGGKGMLTVKIICYGWENAGV